MFCGDLIMVDAIDHGQVGAGGRGGDDHPLGASRQMHRRLLAGSEYAGAFEHDIDAERAMRQLGRVTLSGDLDRAATKVNRILADFDLAGEPAVIAVPFQ